MPTLNFYQKRTLCEPTHQTGVALLEVLVTMVVMAVGLLSLLLLQMNSLNFAREAEQNFVAAALAQSMGERMRANAENAGTYATGNWDQLGGGCAGVCALDVNTWFNSIDTTFPNQGQGNITVNGNVVTIQIRWLERNADNANDFTSYNYQIPFNPNVRQGANGAY